MFLKRVWILFFISLYVGWAVKAADVPQQQFYTTSQTAVYFLIWDLEFEKASALLAKVAKKEDPAYFALKSLHLSLRLFLKGDETHYYLHKSLSNSLLDSLEFCKKDARYFHSLALIKLHRALLHSAFGEGLSGAWEMRQSFLLFKQNMERSSYCIADQAYYGAFSVALSNIPENYQWTAQLIGLQGDEKKGFALLRQSEEHGDEVASFEVKLFSVLLKNYLQYSRNEILEEYEILQKKHNKGMVCVLGIWLYNKNNASDKALGLHSQLDGKLAYPYFHYLYGITHFQKMNFGESKQHLLYYISSSPFKNYKKDSFYKLSEIYSLEGDSAKALRYKEKVKKLGADFYYADKLALRQASSKEARPKEMTLAKIAFDGGMFSSSLQSLSSFKTNQVKWLTAKYYLKARNYDLMEEQEEATLFYKKTLEFCPKEGVYMGPISCLHLARHAKEKGDKKSMEFYLNALSQFKNYEYKKSIAEKAEKLKKSY